MSERCDGRELAGRLLAENMIGLGTAARRQPPGQGERPVHPGTVGRWIADGARTADGRRVRLEAVRCGSKWVTSVEALEMFLAALTPALDSARAPRSPAERRRASVQAAAELREHGA